MKKTFKYNLNYIGGIAEYQKRAIYTLNLKENSFSVDGIFKSRKFSYNDIIEVKYGGDRGIKKTAGSCKCFIIWTNGVIR